MDMHEYRARYESRIAIARGALTRAEQYAIGMGDESAAADLQSIILTLTALMSDSLDRKPRKQLRGQLSIVDEFSLGSCGARTPFARPPIYSHGSKS